jgi:hypothetical protein
MISSFLITRYSNGKRDSQRLNSERRFEYTITYNLSMFFEDNYYHFDTRTVSLTSVTGSS